MDKFFVKYLDYKLFGRLRPYINGAIQIRNIPINKNTQISNDLYLRWGEEDIKKDSMKYYEEKKCYLNQEEPKVCILRRL